MLNICSGKEHYSLHKGLIMLVLTRKASEAIQIGGEIKVKVLRISGGRVRIGIEAPGGVRITREEIPIWENPEDGELTDGEIMGPVESSQQIA
jgi:carbon storage regulator